MMLQALIGYAEREGIGSADDAFFQAVEVHWAIPLTAEGKLADGPISYASDDPAKKQKTRRLQRPFTSVNELGQGDKSHFLCDSLERAVVFLDAKTPEKAAGRRVQHGYFKKLLAEAAAACPGEKARLEAVLAFLADEGKLDSLHRKLTEAKAKPTDNALFLFGATSLLDSGEIKEFWRARRRAMFKVPDGEKGKDERVCIATGELGSTLDTTDKIKGVPGGLAVGTNLISFDKDAFCSYGLEQAQNAALSAPAELKIRLALNGLIEESRKDKLVFNDTAYLHWTRVAGVDDGMDLFANPVEKAVRDLLRSVQDGKKPLPTDDTAYYAMGISGNGARIVVRDWLESTVGEVKGHLAKWFADLAIIQLDGADVRHDFKFGALLYGMVRSDLAELPPYIPTQLFHAAIHGGALPLTALAAALRRQQIEPTSDDALRRGAIVARMALIKACLRRSLTKFPTDALNPNHTMSDSLNPDSDDHAYNCGCLFAVFDRLQYFALGGVNAGVVERFYASASVTPALVMGRLFRNAQFHLAKADGGIAENVRKDFEKLSIKLGTKFHKTLSLEEQGRFALGYYHQKAEFRRRSTERKEKAAHEAAQPSPETAIA